MPIPELRRTLLVGKEKVPHLWEMESRGRTSHVHWDGCEVQRQFYVNHFTAATDVCEALLGFVLKVGSTYVRYLPAFDPYYDQILYCNEARWDHVDGDKKSISNSPAINGAAGEVPALDAYNHFKTQVNTIPERAEGGAFITASYRPLISGYHPQRYNNLLTAADRDRQFDFMDPLLMPGTQTVPWPDGVQSVSVGVVTGRLNPDNVSAELADPLTIPLIQFSVRRMFLGKVPYRTLDKRLNTVNNAAWPTGTPGDLVWPWTFPQFPAETLRFDSYEETRHWSQSSDLNKWHEVKLNFSWRNHYAFGIRDRYGLRIAARSPVTWNHILRHPWDEVLAWYRLFRRWEDRGTIQADFYESWDFDVLFEPVTPQSQ
ncbi:MAG: hypothetical protein V3U39_12345 [Acidimicrobiia bacterium]